MFCIYGKYQYEKPLSSVVCFKSADVMESFLKIQNDKRGFWVGYICYEALSKTESKTPLLEFVLFSERKKWKQNYIKSDFIFSQPLFYPSVLKDLNKGSYAQAFSRIKDELSAGNTYQVNFTQDLHLTSHCDGFEIFKALHQRQKTPYCCYFKSEFVEIISLSPELFFKKRKEKITFAPMKGTIKRGQNSKQDKQLKKLLKSDSKSQSENLMIVDLLRNDMSKIIKLGSLKIPYFLKVLKFKTLFQMISILKARLKTKDLGEIFSAVFPCGSITGAPKLSTMRVIAELEQRERGVYCGALGVIKDERATFSVPIRTLSKDSKESFYHYGVGSGIVWDSNCEEEFKELQLKAQFLTPKLDFMLFETMLMYEDKIFLLYHHKKRLINSAKKLGFRTHKLGFLEEIEEIEMPKNLSLDDFLTLKSKKLESLFTEIKKIPYFQDLQGDEQCYKVHLILQKNGDFSLKASLLDSITTNQVKIANAPLNSQNDLLYHKTTLRAKLPKNCFDVLYFNQNNALCEGSRSNLVLLKDGQFLTPSLKCGMLGGTLREVLLQCGILKEQVLLKEDLNGAKIFCINSLRGVVPVELV
ncbi:bifunctional anthranilate synthase component I family protein/class IV aminotransferase [uncultured Helicobacter sp.]|mgnify:CR=1 FL=1|uniref:bifunctional chorismate-binding protein/class IV aminotransferase n=1 Tax=uncultured Helicobacter sp. TaxID=175537 RepID=UPI002629B701|nr:bifunctional anthranilate synthase component I family protein/class IV aminotransferase [uncultured Helicobacter sp.]